MMGRSFLVDRNQKENLKIKNRFKDNRRQLIRES
jgi:hypothetical protein